MRSAKNKIFGPLSLLISSLLSWDFVMLIWQTARQTEPVHPAVPAALSVCLGASALTVVVSHGRPTSLLVRIVSAGAAAILAAALIHETHYLAYQSGLSAEKTIIAAMFLASLPVLVVFFYFGLWETALCTTMFVVIYVLAAILQGGEYSFEELARTPVGTFLFMMGFASILHLLRKMRG